jgi:hypothetical protein
LGTGIKSSWGTCLKAEGILGYSILCLENRKKPVILACKNSSRLSGLEAHATPSEQQKPLICGYLSTSLPKSLNMSCSKLSAPKLYLDLRPYSQNTVHKLFSRVVTVASFAILILLRLKCSSNCSAYFDKNVTYCTQENYFRNIQGHCYFCTGASLRIEGGMRLIFWGKGLRQITTDTSSRRQIITATLNHTAN